ncbi:MAG: hypothetical protein ACREVH_11370 [Gammaproteobacteria bacterium]
MGIDVLRYIDVVVGFSVVMLLASTVVTAITQAFIRFCNLRGRNLRNGVVQLITQVDPLLEPHAQAIAESVLKHRLVAEPESMFGPLLRRVRDGWRGWGLDQRLGGVIQREELIRLLAELAADGLPARAFAGDTDAEREAAATAAKQKLKQAIGADPAALLSGIRKRSLELERNAPWLATHIRQTRAIIDAAANDVVGTATEFVGKVNAWFDESMDRVSQTFAQHTRVLTILGAAIVALGLPLDSLDLLERLSVDDTFRASLVDRGKEIAQKQVEPATTTGGEDSIEGGAAVEAKETEQFSLQIEKEKIKQQLAELQNPQLAIIPPEWWIEHNVSTLCTETTELTSQNPPILTVADKAISVSGNTLGAVRDAINASGAPLRADVQPCDLGSWLTPTRKKGQYLVVWGAVKPPLPTIELRTAVTESDNLLVATQRFRPGVLSETLRRPGILLSVLLLSLGAPFWFEVLKTGLKLRSSLAGKEEKEREERKSSQDAAAFAPATPPQAPPATAPAPTNPMTP